MSSNLSKIVYLTLSEKRQLVPKYPAKARLKCMLNFYYANWFCFELKSMGTFSSPNSTYVSYLAWKTPEKVLKLKDIVCELFQYQAALKDFAIFSVSWQKYLDFSLNQRLSVFFFPSSSNAQNFILPYLSEGTVYTWHGFHYPKRGFQEKRRKKSNSVNGQRKNEFLRKSMEKIFSVKN